MHALHSIFDAFVLSSESLKILLTLGAIAGLTLIMWAVVEIFL